MNRAIAASGAAMAGLGVALGAFGTHWLKGALTTDALGWWETAVRYQMWSAIALVALGIGRFEVKAPAALLGGGASIFSATLYAMALGAPRWLGAVTPIGGALTIAGWTWLAWRISRGGADPNDFSRR